MVEAQDEDEFPGKEAKQRWRFWIVFLIKAEGFALLYDGAADAEDCDC